MKNIGNVLNFYAGHKSVVKQDNVQVNMESVQCLIVLSS